VGGAIGALIGQSFDQQVLAPATRGPRLGDLSVQSSSYGTAIPRIYGSMRVAGSVVWATDLVESEQTTGAKGQPDVTYSYSVSLAVALSSRPIATIKRIWADGKLLRGSEGDFKVPVTFRFYEGNESQDIDPLIGSIEGIANCPAYRGTALAVFENMELAEFGNRIPFMTFEVVADEAPPSVSAILQDASRGAISAGAAETVIGYAAYGRSMAAAVQPLVDSFGVALFDDGATLRAPADDGPVELGAEELGSSADGQSATIAQREQLPVGAAPTVLRLTYYDPARDYQTGEARAAIGAQGGTEIAQELPAVFSADLAKGLVHRLLARKWSDRDRLTLRLPPSRMGLEPGSVISSPVASGSWQAVKCVVDGFATIVELQPCRRGSPDLVAAPGRVVADADVVEAPTALTIIDAPFVLDGQAASPTVLVAASTPTPKWSARTVKVTASGGSIIAQTAAQKSVLGRALTILADAEPYLFDCAGAVDVELVDPQQWIMSAEDDALADGANLALIGSELVQFGHAVPLGPGRFRLTRLLRGRAGTDWATGCHVPGELFCIVDSNSLRPVAVPIWARGSAVEVESRDGSQSSVEFAGEAVRPFPPANLGCVTNDAGDLLLSWVRRSRFGIPWLDEIDAPLGESRELYSVTITAAAGSLELSSAEPALLVAAANVAGLGAGTALVEVRQLGDFAASRAARLTVHLS
jgi:hypothetical protein